MLPLNPCSIITEFFSLQFGALSPGFKQVSLWGLSLWFLSSETLSIEPRPLSLGYGALSIWAPI